MECYSKISTETLRSTKSVRDSERKEEKQRECVCRVTIVTKSNSNSSNLKIELFEWAKPVLYHRQVVNSQKKGQKKSVNFRF